MELLNSIIRLNPIYKIAFRSEQQELPNFKRSSANKFWLTPNSSENNDAIISLTLSEAQIIYSFEEERTITASLFESVGDDLLTIVCSLIYDNIIQVKNENGIFESGPNCILLNKYICSFDELLTPNTKASFLSWESICYARYFMHLPEQALAQKIYSYNTYPQLHIYQQYEGWHQFNGNVPLNNQLKNDYNSNALTKPVHWFTWHHKASGIASNLFYKLYVSPKPADVAPVLSIIAETCYQYAVPAFKVGASLAGILRPDKIVLYFPTRHFLLQVASILKVTLQGVDAQGIPFTNPLDKAGLLSWATEPKQNGIIQLAGHSWRIYVALSIAKFLKLAHVQRQRFDVHAVLQRLRFDKIEPNNWNTLTN